VSGDADLLERFVAFSAEATAFSTVDLWGTGQAADYLATVHEEAGDQILRDLLDAARPGPAGDEVFTDEKLGPLARNIIKLWYSGVWYELPPQWAARFGAPVKAVPAQRRPGQHGVAGHSLSESKGPLEQQGRQRTPARCASYVVSAAAYTEGLLWRAIGAHPSGAKAPGYGSWAVPPEIDGYEGDHGKKAGPR
jgi:hypothetical protein